MHCEKPSLEKRNEELIDSYFKKRGWSVDILDRPGRAPLAKAADRVASHSGYRFLYEVKTITSARADMPYTPVRYFEEMRTRRQAELEKWMEAHPDSRLIMTREQYEFVLGDDGEFRKRHQHKSRNTQRYFEAFIKRLETCLLKSSIGNLPYEITLHSDDLYRPNDKEFENLSRWFEAELPRINQGEPSFHWEVIEKGPGSFRSYCALYRIHTRRDESDVDRNVQVVITGPTKGSRLEVKGRPYGTYNLDRIEGNVRKASTQLASSASELQNEKIPRIVILAFARGLNLEWWLQGFEEDLAWLLERYPKLSALAILDFELTTPPFPRFMVYHSSWLRDVERLAPRVFSDNRSSQLRYVDGNWQV